MGYYNTDELRKMGFKYLGKEVMLSKLARVYNPEKTELHDYCRIDDFCVLMGKITLHKYVHLALYTHLGGTNEGIVMEEHSECAYRCAIITHSSDYNLSTLHVPYVDSHLKNGRSGAVYIGKYSLIGYDSLIMPSVKIGEGVSVGAFSFVNHDLDSWGIYDGKPAEFVRKIKKSELLDNVELFYENEQANKSLE